MECEKVKVDIQTVKEDLRRAKREAEEARRKALLPQLYLQVKLQL
jgi:hypothetical protein